jgi:YVTN family beta-propeller protein
MKILLLILFVLPNLVFAQTKFSVDHRIKLTGSTGWDILSIDKLNRLFVTRGDHVDVIDLKTEKVIGTITKGIDGAHAVAFVDNLNKGYVTSGKNAKIVVFDLKSLEVLKDIPAGKKADVIIYDHFSSSLFAFNADDHTVTVINPKNDTVLGTIPLSSNPEFAVSDEKGHVYVNLEESATVAVIDAKKLKIISERHLAGCESPTGIAIDLKNNLLLSACQNEVAAISDLKTGKVIKTVAIGKNPDGAAFDNGLFFTSNGVGSLSIIQSNKNQSFEVLQNLETQKGARTMVIDSFTHTAYLLTARYEPLDPKSERKYPKIIADSVEVLVVKNKK